MIALCPFPCHEKRYRYSRRFALRGGVGCFGGAFFVGGGRAAIGFFLTMFFNLHETWMLLRYMLAHYVLGPILEP
jgi:hypothetical protein